MDWVLLDESNSLDQPLLNSSTLPFLAINGSCALTEKKK